MLEDSATGKRENWGHGVMVSWRHRAEDSSGKASAPRPRPRTPPLSPAGPCGTCPPGLCQHLPGDARSDVDVIFVKQTLHLRDLISRSSVRLLLELDGRLGVGDRAVLFIPVVILH